jgi:2-keto-4-pentenoate hydratase/2-oxohepta-3-ene-1,7-dioic acid hydratase in catechol pathway
LKLYRYSNSGSPALAVEHNGRLLNCESLFQAAGQRTPDVVARADMRAICAAPEVVIEFLKQFLAELPDTAAADAPAGIDLNAVHLLAPIPDPSKIICIGLNYLDHCEEQNKPRPERPMLFAKFPNTIAGPYDDVEIPTNTSELDFEGELAVVIGRKARRVARENALPHVFGYMALQDVSARDLQRTDGQWVRAKSQDGFAPCGPCIVTADEIADPQTIGIRTIVNGHVMQDSSTANMIFPIDELIAFVSDSLTLLPGDIISTGTPAGVGVHRRPQVLLKSGDVAEVTLEGIGTLRNRFV